VAHVPPTKRQRMANGFRPIEEADYPHDPCFLRLGPGDYTIGFCADDAIWLRLHDLVPVQPTHFRDYPD
jgi:hypothetical protein